jgi:hypothetical protein
MLHLEWSEHNLSVNSSAAFAEEIGSVQHFHGHPRLETPPILPMTPLLPSDTPDKTANAGGDP